MQPLPPMDVQHTERIPISQAKTKIHNYKLEHNCLRPPRGVELAIMEILSGRVDVLVECPVSSLKDEQAPHFHFMPQ